MGYMNYVLRKNFLKLGLPWYVGILFWGLQLLLLPGLSAEVPEKLEAFFDKHCTDCHDDELTKGGLDLLSLEWNLEDAHNESIWVKIYDQVASGEMPPEKKSRLSKADREAMTNDLG